MASPDKETSCISDFITKEHLEQVSHFKTLPSDIFVVTYPKSGTTWMTSILLHFLSKSDPSDSCDGSPLMAAIPWLEYHPAEKIESAQTERSRRLFKSHLPYEFMPSVGERRGAHPPKFIYIARNPKDVAVSYFHHHRLFEVYQYTGNWPNFFGRFMAGDVEFRSWFDHVSGWWEHRHDDNVLFLTFEDMKKDARKCVKQTIEFLGISVSDHLLNTTVEKSDFKEMQIKEEKGQILPDPKEEPEMATREGHRFLRKGVVGDWKNYFDAEQNRKLDERLAETLRACPGLTFTFE